MQSKCREKRAGVVRNWAKKNRGLGGIRRKASTAFCLSNHLCHRNTTLRLQPSDILYQPKTTNLNEP